MMKKLLKNRFFYIALAFLILVILIARLPSGQGDGSSVRVVEELLSAQAEPGELTGSVSYSGIIADNGSCTLSLAGSVTVEQWQVQAGDCVQKGQVLATINKNSALAAMAELDELTRELDAAIEDSRSDAISSTISAPADGRVKAIYPQTGESIADVMVENSALLLLSLDGKMAVDIPADTLVLGQNVTVELSDGATLVGTVSQVTDGMATITVSDETAPCDDLVTVTDGQGSTLGSGNLYIHSQVKVTGYAGVVEQCYVSLNTSVSQGQSLFRLSDTGYTGNYNGLLAQRRVLEEQMHDLFVAWQTGEVCAEVPGYVTQILAEDNSATGLAFLTGSGSLALLNAGEPEPDPGEGETDMVKYLAQVTEVTVQEDGSRELELALSDGSSLILRAEQLEGLTGAVAVSDIETGDILTLFYSREGQLLSVTVYKASEGGNMPADDPTGFGGMEGGLGGISGGQGGMSGSGESQEQIRDYTMAETQLCTFTPCETASIDLTVDELDIAGFSLGQTVSVSLDALGGESFEAQVTAIDPEGSNSGGNSKYTVTVTLPRTENMLTGMTANVSLTLETRQNGLLIPLAALQEDASGVYVYTGYNKRTDTLTDPIPVTTGAADGEQVEILSGLEAGDSVYYRYASGLEYTFKR